MRDSGVGAGCKGGTEWIVDPRSGGDARSGAERVLRKEGGELFSSLVDSIRECRMGREGRGQSLNIRLTRERRRQRRSDGRRCGRRRRSVR